MPRHPDRLLIRYLHGELPAAEVQRLRAELAGDPALQARLAELHRLWQGMKAEPPTPVPFGYVPRLQRLADQRRAQAGTSLLGLGAAPPWARALAGAALAAGVALGIGLGRVPQAAGPGTEPPVAAPGNAIAETAGASVPTQAGPPAAQRSPLAVASAPAQGPAAGSEEPGQEAAASAAPAGVAAAGGDVVAEGVSGSGGTLAEEYWEAIAGDSGDDGSDTSW